MSEYTNLTLENIAEEHICFAKFKENALADYFILDNTFYKANHSV